MQNLIYSLLKNEEVIKKFKYPNIINSSDETNEALLISSSFLASNKCFVIIKNSLYNAQRLYDRLSTFLNNEEIYLYPTDESLRLDAIAESKELIAERVYILSKILKNERCIIVTHTSSIIRHLPLKEDFEKSFINLKIGDVFSKDKLINLLEMSGYERVVKIDHSLQYAIRGGVIDIFSVNYNDPIRIEYFDDEIDSIRFFNLVSQRTVETLKSIEILPASELVIDSKVLNSKIDDLENKLKELSKKDFNLKHEVISKLTYEIMNLKNRNNNSTFYKYYTYLLDNKTSSLLEYFNKDNTLFILSNESLIRDNYDLFMQELLDYKLELLEVNNNFIDYNFNLDLNNLLTKYNFIRIEEFSNSNNKIETRSVSAMHGNKTHIASLIEDYNKRDYKVILCLDNGLQIDFIKNIYLDLDYDLFYLKDNNIKEKNYFIEKNIKEGFELVDQKIVFISTNELFGNYHINKTSLTRFKNAQVIRNVDNLSEGDYVVHEVHGIGKYKGISTLEIEGIHHDYLNIVYKDDVEIFVPLEQFKLVRKYVSKEGVVPKLNKVGSNEWAKTKQRIKNRVNDIADKLIKLYSERNVLEGFSYEVDDELVNDFFSSFPYELTSDQMKAYLDIVKDMQSNVPMDRLICGDVGFGKTELAFRAAYIAILNNKQVAMLCPTTLLSRQHFKVALERFQNFGINIKLVNRFVSIKEQNQIINDLKEGKIDFIIGTHRLLNSDFVYKDLGLLIVDEEHRFGVAHKERIKELKTNVDVLTLSATPIPRTLQMSLIGIRNLSQIETAPLNRMPVQTYVMERKEKLIKEIIERELGRNGQVFYLYNNTTQITSFANDLARKIKGAKIVVGHGKMDKDLLEETMMKFYNHEANVLICTTIIENGIDIPNANTIIIDNADRFGLSQLYQIKGRVGRGDRLGYAYLFYSGHKEMNDEAKKRLKTIKEFSELGSGYRIAMRDLSIRGAGDILGSEQSGFIDSVGIDMYLQILKETIDEKKNGVIKEETKTNTIINVDGYIPNKFESNDLEKIDLYKKIDALSSLDSIINFSNEILDLYGKTPDNVKLLLEKKRLEVLSDILYLKNINDTKLFIELTLNENMSNIDGIGIKLFELTYKLSKDFTLSFKDGFIKIKLLKKEKNWLITLNELLHTLKDDYYQ